MSVIIEKAIKEAHDYAVRQGATKIETVVYWGDKVKTTIETSALGNHAISKDMEQPDA